jgi:hypothetical protein
MELRAANLSASPYPYGSTNDFIAALLSPGNSYTDDFPNIRLEFERFNTIDLTRKDDTVNII